MSADITASQSVIFQPLERAEEVQMPRSNPTGASWFGRTDCLVLSVSPVTVDHYEIPIAADGAVLVRNHSMI